MASVRLGDTTPLKLPRSTRVEGLDIAVSVILGEVLRNLNIGHDFRPRSGSDLGGIAPMIPMRMRQENKVRGQRISGHYTLRVNISGDEGIQKYVHSSDLESEG